ncbi:hypothetical protein HYPSUDRAFT_41363 [Hypholoma sublateritium FD-334 SS-4]|uniref:DUF6533 domain-containing protein n=1 Tax=Hypholoma sublateritium (strain FD-334 SS-4) TaxID=945553 RepID=A0A0D2PQU8_HYPSF|nr:hypothetical protein HYPSUDRAFT_41363 [Hypholoma sublateritium FD-334 SS-4]
MSWLNTLGSSSDLPSVADQIVDFKSVRNGNYSSVVTLTILVYNAILVFPQEVEHIWRSKWSLPKVLYIFLRYCGIIHTAILLRFSTSINVPRQRCQVYYWLVALEGPVIFAMAVNVLLTMRINALYGRSSKVMTILTFLVLCQFGFSTYVHSTTTIQTVEGVPPFMNVAIPGCITVVAPEKGLLLASWLVAFAVTGTFFCMTMYKLCTGMWLREAKGKGNFIILIVRNRHYTPLLAAFFGDGVVYYFLITALLLTSTLMEQLALPVLGSVPIPWLVGVYSFAGANLVLGLRKAAAQNTVSGAANWETTLSAMYFAPDMAHNSEVF